MIIIERTITINNDKATLDKPIYFYVGDGNITCIFTIKEKEKAARFGTVGSNNIIQDNEDIDYGEAKIYKPDQYLVSTNRAEIIDNKLQIDFNWDNMDHKNEAGRHQLQIHLYDSNSGERNRLTIPPIDIYVLLPIGTETTLIDEAMVGYSLLNVTDEEIPAFDKDGNYNMTVWEKGDIITKNKLNKLEEALYQVTTADDNFVTNEALGEELANKADAIHIHTVYDIEDIADVAKTGSYNDLHNAPNMDAYATKIDLGNKAGIVHYHSEYASRAELENKANKSHGHDNYALKSAIPTVPTKLSDLVNDRGYITSSEIPDSYVTESELSSYNYATENYVDGNFASVDYVKAAINAAVFPQGDSNGIDLSAYALKSEIPVRTSQLTNNSGFITNDALVGYATTTYVNDTLEEGLKNVQVDLSNYPTKDDMNNTLNTALADKADVEHDHENYSLIDHRHDDTYVLKEELPTIPTKLSDLEDDMGYAIEEDVNEALSNKANREHYHDDNYSPLDHTHDNYALKDNVNTAINDINNNLTNNYALKRDIPTVPTNVSAFTNDAKYMTSNTITRIEVVDILPPVEEQVEGVIYIVMMI